MKMMLKRSYLLLVTRNCRMLTTRNCRFVLYFVPNHWAVLTHTVTSKAILKFHSSSVSVKYNIYLREFLCDFSAPSVVCKRGWLDLWPKQQNYVLENHASITPRSLCFSFRLSCLIQQDLPIHFHYIVSHSHRCDLWSKSCGLLSRPPRLTRGQLNHMGSL